MSEKPKEEPKAEVSAHEKAVAKLSALLIDNYWLSQVERMAHKALKENSGFTMLPPSEKQYEAAKNLILAWSQPPTSELAVAVQS